MVEMGELREGVMRDEIISFYKKVFKFPYIEIIGIGTNLGCMYGIQPTYDKLIQLRMLKELIEVKFRKSEIFTFRDLPKDYPYENCYFIIVSKKHIKCISYEELKQGNEVTPTSRNYLGNRKEFDLDREVIIDFCNFAVKFFDVV